jgi:hypothetical protein
MPASAMAAANGLVGEFGVRPRSDLRHDAQIGRMFFQLGVDLFRQDLDPAVRRKADHCCSGLVAAGFDAEKGQRACHAGHIAPESGRPKPR